MSCVEEDQPEITIVNGEIDILRQSVLYGKFLDFVSSTKHLDNAISLDDASDMAGARANVGDLREAHMLECLA